MNWFAFFNGRLEKAIRCLANRHQLYDYQIMNTLTTEEALQVITDAGKAIQSARTALKDALAKLAPLERSNADLKVDVDQLRAEDARLDEALSALRGTVTEPVDPPVDPPVTPPADTEPPAGPGPDDPGPAGPKGEQGDPGTAGTPG